MAGKSADLGWKVIGGLSAVAAGIAARKVVEFAWSKVTGGPPPTSPEDPDVTWREAIAWSVASGVTVALARLITTRQAVKVWHRATGELPAAIQQARAEVAEAVD